MTLNAAGPEAAAAANVSAVALRQGLFEFIATGNAADSAASAAKGEPPLPRP